MVAHAVLAVLLARLCGTGDVVIGTPVAGRGVAALDELVGMFVNTVVLRTAIDPAASFAEVMRAVRETDLGAFGHAEVPFERVVEALDPARSAARSPLFQVMLVSQSVAATGVDLPGEAPGYTRPPSEWSATSPYNIPIGQEIQVTLLQLATARSEERRVGKECRL